MDRFLNTTYIALVVDALVTKWKLDLQGLNVPDMTHYLLPPPYPAPAGLGGGVLNARTVHLDHLQTCNTGPPYPCRYIYVTSRLQWYVLILSHNIVRACEDTLLCDKRYQLLLLQMPNLNDSSYML